MVHFGPRTRPSGVKLQEALTQAGYDGPQINFGYSVRRDALNKPEALRLASNKRLALEAMSAADVPVPYLCSNIQAAKHSIRNGHVLVGRPDSHRQGRGFWVARTADDVDSAIAGRRRKAAATHFMEYIDAEHEFRVHVVNGKSIKISEKIGGGNHTRGATFRYPENFNHKKTLRRTAKKAVEALGLDFGAVDILWADGQPYVTEINTAPCLTDNYSDTLQRYVNAFMEVRDDNVGVGRGDDESVPTEHVCACGDPDCDID